MLLNLHTDFSGDRSGGPVFPSLEEFSTVYCDPHIEDFGIVNKIEVDVFLELSCFFYEPMDVGNVNNMNIIFYIVFWWYEIV